MLIDREFLLPHPPAHHKPYDIDVRPNNSSPRQNRRDREYHWGGLARSAGGFVCLALAAWEEGLGPASAALVPFLLAVEWSSSTADAASFTSVRSLVCSSATGSRQMFGEMTFARPDAVSIAPNRPMNCQPDQGARPPSAAAFTVTPIRFTNESTKTRARPRKARPRPLLDVCVATRLMHRCHRCQSCSARVPLLRQETTQRVTINAE
jgi:hypothetical protein